MPFDFQAWADAIGKNFCERKFDLNGLCYRFPAAYYEGETVEVLSSLDEYIVWAEKSRARFDPYDLKQIVQEIQALSVNLKDRRVLRVRSQLLDSKRQTIAIYTIKFYLEFSDLKPKIGMVQVVDGTEKLL